MVIPLKTNLSRISINSYSVKKVYWKIAGVSIFIKIDSKYKEMTRYLQFLRIKIRVQLQQV